MIGGAAAVVVTIDVVPVVIIAAVAFPIGLLLPLGPSPPNPTQRLPPPVDEDGHGAVAVEATVADAASTHGHTRTHKIDAGKSDRGSK